ncbi:uncharacterized protein LOC118468977 [Anopheles albimanus]|uniref:uncharacterized protein LOC118468977 n=1 Tax=Anopheles albimanus TaxID=7167 RepID=UPI00163E8C9F|nr:uncharacterized protein LOC118468977 [Anopheles albimanus]
MHAADPFGIKAPSGPRKQHDNRKMIPRKCILLWLSLAVALLASEGHGLAIEPRMKRDMMSAGVELDISGSSVEANRAGIPVISDIQRVEKIADLIISVGERIIPALLDDLTEQVIAATPERKLSHQSEKETPGHA